MFMYIYAAFSPQSQHNQFKDLSAKTHTHTHTQYMFLFQWLFQPFQGSGLSFSSVIIFYRPWTGDQPVTSPLPNTGQHKHQTSMT
jgi:hypothetical protein